VEISSYATIRIKAIRTLPLIGGRTATLVILEIYQETEERGVSIRSRQQILGLEQGYQKCYAVFVSSGLPVIRPESLASVNEPVCSRQSPDS
jgi:hypothetical protein